MEKNIWEQLEEHINDNLGTYGLNMMDRFLDIKEIAEDLGLCPDDTEERQSKLEEMHG